MQHWLDRGWTGHQIRHWYSLRQAKRNDDGTIIRSTKGQNKTQEKMIVRDHKRAIIEDRKEYRGLCCTCPSYADHGLGCPMRRPSRSPNFKRTPWVWSHGDGRGK
eukprot:7352043-Pyramimonas_sp.AAC.1